MTHYLAPPDDGLPFSGKPGGEFPGYAWMALPLIPTNGIGDQSWTLEVGQWGDGPEGDSGAVNDQ